MILELYSREGTIILQEEGDNGKVLLEVDNTEENMNTVRQKVLDIVKENPLIKSVGDEYYEGNVHFVKGEIDHIVQVLMLLRPTFEG